LSNQSTNTATKPFTLDVVLKELGSLSHGLRGSDSKDVDSAGILSTVKDIANSYLSSIQVIQGHYRNGNKGKAAAAMRATVGDVSDLIKANKEAEATKKDLGFPTVINSVTLFCVVLCIMCPRVTFGMCVSLAANC